MRLFLLSLCILFCGIVSSAQEKYPLDIKANSTFTVDKVLDLGGKALKLPEGVTLKFGKRGAIVNGVVRGRGTRLDGKAEGIFKGVEIRGSWIVPVISSDMFTDISEENALVQLFALTSPEIGNVVTIKPGDYTLTAKEGAPNVISVTSNTRVVIDGRIILKTNALDTYRMFDVQGENIIFQGKGSIEGDRDSHTGTEGEWGMGISVLRSKNVIIENLNIKDCWGDCIYIGKRSENVVIRNCHLDNSRRQGVSIVSAKSVYISDCLITNIHGTNPQYGIDVEPNRRDTVDFVAVSRVNIVDCKGGITVSCSPTKECQVSRIEIRDCNVSGGVERYSYKFSNTNTVVVKNCTGVKRNIRFKGITNVYAENNRISHLEDKSTYQISRCVNVVRR